MNGVPGNLNTNWDYRVSGTGNTGDTYTTDNWLRLTNANLGQATNILNDVAFPSSTGFRVTFDYRQAGGVPFSSTTTTGDGIAMYLINGTQTISVGGSGAGLGYANRGAGNPGAGFCNTGITGFQTGVTGGYLGLGLDVFGNFASPNWGNSGGPNWTGYSGGIDLRGSGSGCGPDMFNGNYPWVAGAQSSTLWTGINGDTRDPATYDSMYRRVTITVQPQGSNVQVTVAMSPLTVKTAEPGAMTQVFSANLNGVTGQVPLPSTLKLGFSASTGAATDYHDIRGVSVASLADTSITKTLSTTTPGHTGYPAGTFLPNDPISFTLTGTNNGPYAIGDAPDGVARVYDDLTDLPITDVSWTCTAAGGAACANGSSGTGPIVSQEWTAPKGGSVTVTVNGTVTAARGSFTNTAILPTDFVNNVVDPLHPDAQKDGGTVDTDVTNNTATASFSVIGPHFTQTKTADATSYTVGEPITYTVTVANDGASPGTASLDDVVPATVAVSDVSCAGSGGATCTASHTGNHVTGTVDSPVGGSVDFTIHGTVTAGPSVTNIATVTATTPTCTEQYCGGGDAETPDLPVKTPSLTVEKTAWAGSSPANDLVVGQALTYHYRINNTGDVELGNIGVTETAFTGHGAQPVVTCPTAATDWPSGTVGVLAPGQTITCTAPYTVLQADADAGTMSNTATAHGTPTGVTTPVVSDPSTATLPTTSAPALTVTKTASLTGLSNPAKAGDPVVYTVTAENTGNLTLHDVSLTDSLTGLPALTYTWPTGGTAGLLLPGDKVTGTATYHLTQTDLDNGTLANTAVGNAKDPSDGPVTDQATVTTDLTLTPGYGPHLDVTKTADLSGLHKPLKAGAVIAYTIKAQNTGNVTLHDVALTDSLPGVTVSCPTTAAGWPSGTVGVLAPDDIVSCTASYTLVAADVTAAQVVNTANGTAKDPHDGPVTGSDTITTDLSSFLGPDFSQSKTADQTSYVPGQAITYTVTVHNDGSGSGTASLDDPVPSTVSVTNATCSATPAAGTCTVSHTGNSVAGSVNLPVGGSATFTITGTVLSGPSASNTAVVTPTEPGCDDPGADCGGGDGPTPPIPVYTPGLSLDKTATIGGSSAGPLVAGQQIDYNFVIRNTGETALSTVGVTETAFSGVGSMSAVSCPAGAASLAVGASVTCTATYTVQQGDVDAGVVSNTATAHGTPPGVTTPVVSDPASAQIPSVPMPGLTVTKTASLSGLTAPAHAGDHIAYTITAQNSGAVTLHDVALTDSLPGVTVSCPTTAAGWPSGTVGVLGPNATVTCTASYALTQPNLDAAQVVNTATGTAKDPSDGPVTDTDTITTNLTSLLEPGLTVTKTADLSGFSPTVQVGDPIAYTIAVNNSGDVTLHDVNVTDALTGLGLSALTYTWPTGGTAGVLAPGQTVTVKATYPLKQIDLDNGTVTNTATGNGKDPFDTAVSDSATITSDLTGFTGKALTVTKTADLSGLAPFAAVGKTIAYTITAKNTGVVTLHDLVMTDSLPGVTVSCPTVTSGWPSGTVGVLAPNDMVTCTASYALVTADLAAGRVSNTATGTAKDPSGGTVSDDDTILSDLTSFLGPDFVDSKTTDKSTYVVGETITYTLTTTNQGYGPGAASINDVVPSTVSVTNATCVATPAAGSCTVTRSGNHVTGTVNLPVGGQAVYTITGTVVSGPDASNHATVTPTTPGCDDPAADCGGGGTDTPPVTVLTPKISLTKSGSVAGASATTPLVAGQQITYTFVITNTGETALSSVGVTETAFSGSGSVSTVSCPTTSLAVGASVTCTATYTVTQTDVNAGSVSNTATAHGTPPGVTTPVVSDPASAQVPASNFSGLTVVKTADLSQLSVPVTAGDRVSYTVTATNSGTVTLTDVSVADHLTGLSALTYTWPDGSHGTTGTLLPSQTVTVTAWVLLTQTDIDNGSVSNTAVATGNDPTGSPVTGQDTLVTDLTGTTGYGAHLTVTKTADLSGLAPFAAVGDNIAYTITAKNTGNLTLHGVVLTDSLPSVSVSCPTSAAGWPSGAVGVLAPNDIVTCTGSYALKAADLTAAQVVNTATGTAKDPKDNTVTGDDTITSDLSSFLGPDFVDSKTTDKSTYVVGETITYTLTTTNQGYGPGAASINDVVPSTVSVTNATCVATPAAGSCTVTRSGNHVTGTVNLPVGGQAVYTITGTVVSGPDASNHATVTPTTPGCDDPAADCGGGGTDTPPVTVLTPGISMTKSGTVAGSSPTTPLVAGQQITYTFVITNTGETTLSSVGVTETAFSGAGSVSTVSCPTTSLAVGASVTCTATYTVQQSDVDAGSVHNTATAHGTPPGVTTPVVSDPASAQVPSTNFAGLTVVKTADLSRISPVLQIGDQIGYTVTATNTGDVTLHGITLSDALPGLPALVFTWPVSGTPGVLLPGQTVTAKATYLVTQPDLDRGFIVNTATGHAQDPQGDPVNGDDTITTDLTPFEHSSLTITKTADLTGLGKLAAPGDTIAYTIAAKNTGDVTLHDVVLTDSLAGVSAVCPTTAAGWPSGAVGVLGPNQTVSCTASYTLQQTDLAAGRVVNTATGTATDPQGDTVTGDDTITSDLTPFLAPKFEQSKTADHTSYVPGQAIIYTVTIHNTGYGSGTADLDDPVPSTVTVSNATCSATPAAGTCTVSHTGNHVTGSVNLPAGGSATYTITGTVVSGPSAKNTATVTPTTPGCEETGVDCGGGGTDTPDTPVLIPGISMVKSATANGLPVDLLRAGQEIVYHFAITNTGETVLSNVGVTETGFGGTGTVSPITCPAPSGWPSGTAGVMNPGDVVTCTATYVMSQADVDEGILWNTAKAHGTPPGVDTPVESNPASAEIPVNPDPSMEVIKTADLSNVRTPAQVGDEILYTITAKNTGAVTLHNVTVTDTLPGLTDVVYSWPDGSAGTTGDLIPGGAVTVTARYPLTQTDMDNGAVINTATSTGKPPATPSNPDPETIPPTSDTLTTDLTDHLNPSLTMAKSASAATYSEGTVITYTFTVTNTGNVTISGVRPVEGSFTGSGQLSPMTCPTDTTLSPGETMVCTATYTATAADVTAGTLSNSAVASGNKPGGGSGGGGGGGTGGGQTDSPPSSVTLTANPKAPTGGSVADTAGSTGPLGPIGGALILGAGVLFGISQRPHAKKSCRS